jgi:hypothetical protein
MKSFRVTAQVGSQTSRLPYVDGTSAVQTDLSSYVSGFMEQVERWT